MPSWLEVLDRRARLRAKAGLSRRLRPRGAGDDLLDLAGNDYLGLSRHPEVTAAAAEALTGYGLGATGSRLVRGSTEPHHALEAALADWLGAGRALVFSSGYLANLGAVRALVQPRTLLVADAHNHASLIDGCRLSGAETVVTPHLDVAAVEAALAAAPGRPAVVVTESVFSVDGDLAPLAELHAVAHRYGALLIVDDAHALGVLGPDGAGAVAAAGLSGASDVVVTATLSKALGGAGGVVAGPAELTRHLIDTSRTFIYDTALPPAVAAGVLAATRLARTGAGLRADLA
ncbi:aminotransferase class I/II-fold pyridoxal phosphate-dependent enzyme, partial [Plantactinospora sp. S1510]